MDGGGTGEEAPRLGSAKVCRGDMAFNLSRTNAISLGNEYLFLVEAVVLVVEAAVAVTGMPTS